MDFRELLDLFTGYLSLFKENELWYTKSHLDSYYYNRNYDSLNIQDTLTITNYYVKIDQVDSSSPYDRLRYNSTSDMIEIGTPDDIWITINESIVDQDTRWYYNTVGDAYQFDNSVGFGMDPMNVTAFTALPKSLIAKKTYIDGNVILRVNRSDFLTEDQTTVEVKNTQDEEKSIQLADFFTNIFGRGEAPVVTSATLSGGQIQVVFVYDIYNLSFMGMTMNTPEKLGIKIEFSSGASVEYQTLDNSILSSNSVRILNISEGVPSGIIDSSGNVIISSIANINYISIFTMATTTSNKIYSNIMNL
tara:strand:+ start:75 stop:989 length:915 start_codon:yes stop_codon:yes gene_type:complete